MTQLVHMVVNRLVNKPEKSHCSYRLSHNWVVCIRDKEEKKGGMYVFSIILN